MAFSNLESLYRQVIMDHYKSPYNKGLLDDDAYHQVHIKNPSCGDDITVAVKISKDTNTLEDVRHIGEGCSICCSSASIMAEVLGGKPLSDVSHIVNNFYEIVKDGDINEDLDMGDAIAYVGVSKFPARIKCATIPWKALETAIEEKLEEN